MKPTNRVLLGLLILCICLLGMILLRSFIQEFLITPISLVIWLLLRYVESIDQVFYWGFLIIAILFYLLYRVLGRTHFEEEALRPNSNAALQTMQYWRTMIQITSDEIDKPNILKNDLAWMLASFYSNNEVGLDKNEAYDAMKAGRIPLPNTVYTFLFPVESQGRFLFIRRMLKTIWQAPRKLILHWSGGDLQIYYHSIEEVVNYMESMLETKNDIK